MLKDNEQTFESKKEEIGDMIKKIKGLNEKLAAADDYEYIVDLSGEIIEWLRLIVVIMNNNDGIISDKKIKIETTVLKDYYINYLNGIINNNEYIIQKYKKKIYGMYGKWDEGILDSIQE